MKVDHVVRALGGSSVDERAVTKAVESVRSYWNARPDDVELHHRLIEGDYTHTGADVFQALADTHRIAIDVYATENSVAQTRYAPATVSGEAIMPYRALFSVRFDRGKLVEDDARHDKSFVFASQGLASQVFARVFFSQDPRPLFTDTDGYVAGEALADVLYQFAPPSRRFERLVLEESPAITRELLANASRRFTSGRSREIQTMSKEAVRRVQSYLTSRDDPLGSMIAVDESSSETPQGLEGWITMLHQQTSAQMKKLFRYG